MSVIHYYFVNSKNVFSGQNGQFIFSQGYPPFLYFLKNHLKKDKYTYPGGYTFFLHKKCPWTLFPCPFLCQLFLNHWNHWFEKRTHSGHFSGQKNVSFTEGHAKKRLNLYAIRLKLKKRQRTSFLKQRTLPKKNVRCFGQIFDDFCNLWTSVNR